MKKRLCFGRAFFCVLRRFFCFPCAKFAPRVSGAFLGSFAVSRSCFGYSLSHLRTAAACLSRCIRHRRHSKANCARGAGFSACKQAEKTEGLYPPTGESVCTAFPCALVRGSPAIGAAQISPIKEKKRLHFRCHAAFFAKKAFFSLGAEFLHFINSFFGKTVYNKIENSAKGRAKKACLGI